MTILVDDREAQAKLARIAALAKRPPMGAIADAMEQEVRDTYRRETDPWGAPWPPHAPSTLKARRRRGSASRQKLLDTGAMFASIKREHTETTASVSVGEGLPDPRAVVNQFGNSRIPARAFLPIKSPGTATPTQTWLSIVTAPIERALEDVA